MSECLKQQIARSVNGCGRSCKEDRAASNVFSGSKGKPDAMRRFGSGDCMSLPAHSLSQVGQKIISAQIEGSLTTKQEELISKFGVKI